MTTHEVVKKLIGNIFPVGETNADNERFENLKAMTELVDSLLTDIDFVATNFKNRQEYSIKRANEFAESFFQEIKFEYNIDDRI